MGIESERPPRGCRGRTASWMAFTLAAAVVISLPVTVAARAAGTVVFTPASVSRILSDNLIDSGLLRQVVIQGLFSRDTDGQTTASELGRLMTYANDEQRQAAADIVIPLDWTRAQLEGMVSAFYDRLDSDAPAPEMSIDLASIRTNLLDGGVDDLMDLVWRTWPDCNSDQSSQIKAALESAQSAPFIVCRPQEPTAGLFKQALVSALKTEVQAIPDSLPSSEVTRSGPYSDLQDARRLLATIKLLSNWLWLLPASLLGLIVALVVRSWTGLFRWWGIPLLVGGLLSIALAAWGGRLGSGWLDSQMALAAADVPPALHDAVVGIVSQVDRMAVQAYLRLSLLEAGGAGILTLLGVLITARPDGAEPAGPAHGGQEDDALSDEGSLDGPPSGMFG